MRRLHLPFIVVLVFMLAVSLTAQTPQYYNFNNGTVSNMFPLNVANGKMSQTVVPAGTFANPTPAPAGNITKLYFRISDLYPLGPATYNTFKIMLLHVSSEFVTSGSFITGNWDTVYARATTPSLQAGVNTWLEFTLDHPFTYNPAEPLAISMEHCGASGTYSGYSLRFSTATGSRRTYSSTTGCPHVYSGVSTNIINVGVDISSGPPPLCSIFSNTWCPANMYPVLPAATYFQAAAWLGDTLYVQTPSTAGAGATAIYRYTYGGTWSTGVPCLVAVAGATLTAANGKLYLIGGGASVTAGTNNVQEYNPATGVWTAKAPMPAALAAHGAGCWGDSVIFVFGGPYTGSATNLAVHYYRVATDTWGTIANSLPSGQGRRTFSYGMSGNKIIMSCGYNTAYLNTTYVGTIGSDATQITWTAGPNAPVKLSRPGGTAYSNLFFVVGGDTNGTAVKNDKVYVYNLNSNSWLTPILSNPHPMSNYFSAITSKCFNDTVKIFQPGGYTTVSNNSFDVIGCGGVITGNVNNTTVIPDKYLLGQNYPNPFNPVTKINFTIPKSGFVILKVYDMLGREVANLINADKQAGTYIVDFNASSLSSGVYFYKLEVNGFVDIKKMTLLK